MTTTPALPEMLIAGLGKTGLSVARFLHRRGVPFAVTDSRAEPPGLAVLRKEFPDTPLRLNGLDTEACTQARQIIVSPGISLREPALAAAQAQGVEIVGDIELFARQAQAPTVAITGSNGKSTVTTLLGNMAGRAGRDARVGGNLGTPALDLLTDAPPELYVLELSSFQLETTRSLNAAAAVVLNITPDHMDRYHDLADYVAAKRQIYQGSGVMVVNRDDARVAAMAETRRTCVGFTLAEPQAGDFGVRNVHGERWLAQGDKNLLPVHTLRIKGDHNVANALAALALGTAVGLPMGDMLAALKEFAGLPHRSQWVTEHDGIAWYNDSKGTNVGATLAALSGLGASQGTPGVVAGRIVLIAGGDGKNADFSVLRDAVSRYARAVILIGRDAPAIATALENTVPLVQAHDMKDAVRKAQQHAHSGDAVLLSPACASFDMYSGYEERGRVFTAAVHACLEGSAS